MGNIPALSFTGKEHPIFSISHTPVTCRSVITKEDSDFLNEEKESCTSTRDCTNSVMIAMDKISLEETTTTTTTTSDFADSALSAGDSVVFVVGKERKMMIGQKSKMAAISEVFDAMLKGRWKDGWQVIEISDITPYAMNSLLRFSNGDHTVPLTHANVWETLKAADKYHVSPVIQQCFHFLLHTHPASREPRHICQVLELTHRLHHIDWYQTTVLIAQNIAGEIFRDARCLRELCYECMLKLLKQDYLFGVDESLALEAVMTWARNACAQKCVASEHCSSSWEELRTAAGNLVYHVRYLSMPHVALRRVLGGHPSCLLTTEEKDDLLNHNGSTFPEDVRNRRWTREIPSGTKREERSRKWLKVCLEACVYGLVLVLIALLFVFMIR